MWLTEVDATIGGGSIYKVGGPDAEDVKGMGKV